MPWFYTVKCIIALDILSKKKVYWGNSSIFAAVIKWGLSISDDPTLLSLKKAELILLIKDSELSSNRGWVMGQNERTGKQGAVPTDAIYILPTLTKPSNEVLVRIF